jgi:GT2 family glycosyltransferase
MRQTAPRPKGRPPIPPRAGRPLQRPFGSTILHVATGRYDTTTPRLPRCARLQTAGGQRLSPGQPKRVGRQEPLISVVIATIGRPEKLAVSLAAYEQLDRATPPFEVLIVLDGAGPETRAAASAPRSFPVSVLEQDRAGIGPAKNLGARHAKADYLLFLNDDTRPAPDCLLAHVKAQRELGPCIAIGHVEWDPQHEITPYMRWLAPAGHQFNFSRLKPRRQARWDACWGAHLGVPRAWLLDEPFDPVLPFPTLEDVEWGFRQTRRRRPLRYVPDARCLHDHRYDGPADFRTRARISGAVTRYLVKRQPRLLWPILLRPMAAAAASSVLAVWPGLWRRETLWDLDFRWNYVLGLVTPQRRYRLPRGTA